MSGSGHVQSRSVDNAPFGQDTRLVLGQRLRELRVARSLTTRQIAARSAMSQSRVSRIEAGILAPTSEDLRLILDAVKASSADRWNVLAVAQRLMASAQPGFNFLVAGVDDCLQDEMSRLTDETVEFWGLTHSTVPGMLQTPEYARSLFAVNSLQTSEDVIDAAVLKRMRRQQLLFKKDKRFRFVVTEGALRLRYVSIEQMQALYHHLVKLSLLPNVELRVLPTTAPLCRSVLGVLSILDKERVLVDTGLGMATSDWPEAVEYFMQIFEALHAAALADDEARNFLYELDAELSRESGSEAIAPLRSRL